MLVPGHIAGGRKEFPSTPVLLRNHAVLTTSYVLCQANNSIPDGRNDGEIEIESAATLTLWMHILFGGSQTGLTIKPVYLPPRPSPVSVTVTGLTTAEASDWMTLIGSAGDFSQNMKGTFVKVNSGTNFAVGFYLVTAVAADGSTITLDTAVGSADGSSGSVTFLEEFQDMTHLITTGVDALSPYSLNVPVAVGSGLFVATFQVPAASRCRIYAKGEGTLTNSDLILHYTLGPDGSA